MAISLPHHKAWLSAHPHRSEEWFRERLRDGFDVHHLDGDHGNNEPENLVLIEHSDHMALHNGGTLTLGRMAPNGGKSQRPYRFKKKTVLRRYEEDRDRLAAECRAVV